MIPSNGTSMCTTVATSRSDGMAKRHVWYPKSKRHRPAPHRLSKCDPNTLIYLQFPPMLPQKYHPTRWQLACWESQPDAATETKFKHHRDEGPALSTHGKYRLLIDSAWQILLDLALHTRAMYSVSSCFQSKPDVSSMLFVNTVRCGSG